jgi:hypothetical protein
MRINELSKLKQAENWAGIENLLSKNLQPVSPRPIFINDLRTRLENPESVELEPAGKTIKFFFAVIGLISGLVIMVFTIRFFVNVLTQTRNRRSI